jgi:mRNA interferase MazF
MERDFNRWNEQKKIIARNAKSRSPFPKEQEVWMCVVGKNIGYEQDGSGLSFSRPVIVVKKFNNKMFWVVPLSTKQKELDFYMNFIDLSGQPVSAILAQLKLISIKRFKRNMYELPRVEFEEIRTRLSAYLSV